MKYKKDKEYMINIFFKIDFKKYFEHAHHKKLKKEGKSQHKLSKMGSKNNFLSGIETAS